MSTRAPVGSDWMWTASPIASSDSSGCWARWLPITVKRVVWRVLSWMSAAAWVGVRVRVVFRPRYGTGRAGAR